MPPGRVSISVSKLFQLEVRTGTMLMNESTIEQRYALSLILDSELFVARTGVSANIFAMKQLQFSIESNEGALLTFFP